MLAKMKGLFSRVRVFLGIVAVFALLPAAGGSIVWDAPNPITSLEDVSTNGAMVYAHFCYFSYWTSLYPRGQRFLPFRAGSASCRGIRIRTRVSSSLPKMRNCVPASTAAIR